MELHFLCAVASDICNNSSARYSREEGPKWQAIQRRAHSKKRFGNADRVKLKATRSYRLMKVVIP